MSLKSVAPYGSFHCFSLIACGGSSPQKGSPDGGTDMAKPTGEQGMFTALGVDTTTSPRTYVDQNGATRRSPTATTRSASASRR